ncbi:TetR/AcrR family transcriptional regulator (plasmid) [Rhodococcoides fascians A21d2]|nr:TetR/AcrR family transcriptional regulator [Rhodococcus fascians A21d2]
MSTASRPHGRPPVPVERIIATAVDLLAEHGADALSMRSLAQRLGSGTATLYRHFSGRPELVARVVDSVFAEVKIDTGALRAVPWQQALRMQAKSMFDVLCRHPNVAPLTIEQNAAGPNALALREAALSILLNAGFEPALAVRAWATIARFVLGFATQLRSEDQSGQRVATWTTLNIADYPASVTVASEVPIPLDEEFTFGLSMLIVGLEDILGVSSHRNGRE